MTAVVGPLGGQVHGRVWRRAGRRGEELEQRLQLVHLLGQLDLVLAHDLQLEVDALQLREHLGLLVREPRRNCRDCHAR